MARYNREFLVPYLQDVCALHLAEMEVVHKMFEIQRNILDLKHGREINPPSKPDKEEAWGCFSVLCALAGGFEICAAPIVLIGSLTGNLGSMSVGAGFFLAIVGLITGVVIWRIFVTPAIQISKENDEKDQKFLENMAEYRKKKAVIQQEDEELRKQIPTLENELAYYSNERKKISILLKKAYGVNVLPTQYRDVYAAVYLYDYFRNSRSDDLDQVLNTYVLEQIKDRVDVIIENQRMSIINQRMILTNQHRALEEQRKHNAYMRSKARQISRSVEEQNQYLRMVECNTAATAYFAAANYLK